MENFFLLSKALFCDNDAIYVSCPITTGSRFIKWYTETGKYLPADKYEASKKELVIDRNVRSAKSYISILRMLSSKAIIDPTDLEPLNLGWSQPEFNSFWGRVISDLVSSLILMDGWEYSVGCCHEYLAALKTGTVSTYSQNWVAITPAEAIKKMLISIETYDNFQVPNQSLAIRKVMEEVLSIREGV